MSPLRRLAAIVDLGLRVQGVEERLRDLGVDAFAKAFDELARDSARARTPADEAAMLACALYFARRAPMDARAVHDAAARGGHAVAEALLAEVPARKELSRLGRLRDRGGPRRVLRTVSILHGPPTPERVEEYERFAAPLRAVLPSWPSLDPNASRRRELIRLPRIEVRKQLQRLAERLDASCVPTLLRDPDANLAAVLKVASRRPSMPVIAEAIVAHDGWIGRPEVRVALLENPFTPTRTALLLLPTCRARFRAIAKADGHPRLRALAALFLSAAA